MEIKDNEVIVNKFEMAAWVPAADNAGTVRVVFNTMDQVFFDAVGQDSGIRVNGVPYHVSVQLDWCYDNGWAQMYPPNMSRQNNDNMRSKPSDAAKRKAVEIAAIIVTTILQDLEPIQELELRSAVIQKQLAHVNRDVVALVKQREELDEKINKGMTEQAQLHDRLRKLKVFVD